MTWSYDPEKITYFAATHTRGQHRAFGIRAKDRTKHMYVIGKTGMGKSTMLENLAIQDIQNGEGVCFIDPHGSTAEKLLDFIPQERIKDVVYFAPFDTEYPIGFNVMEDVGYDNRHLVVSGLMGVFERLWADAWSARMSYILQNTLYALLEYPNATLLDVNAMLTNKTFREDVVNHITDPVVEQFWKGEFASYTDRYTQEATPAIQNKIGQLTNNPLIRNILGQTESSINIREMMDARKIFIVNLSKGRMGESNSALLGAMLVVKIYLSAMSRASETAQRQAQLPPFYFYVDEFQSVVNEAFANILSESRKYKLALIVANQYITQMDETVRDAVFGNVGTFIAFRVGPIDAEFIEVMFKPTFEAQDLVNLGLGATYLTLMIDGVGSQPFSAQTLPPIESPGTTYRDDIIEASRSRYAKPRKTIEEHVNARVRKWLTAEKDAHKVRSSAGQKNGKPGGNGTQGFRPSFSKPEVTHEAPKPQPVQARPPVQERQEREVPVQRREETPREAPRSPIETLRAKQTDRHVQQPQKPDVRNALKDAILAAQRNKSEQRNNTVQPEKTEPHSSQEKKHSPPTSDADEIDPKELRKLLYEE